MPYSSFHSEVFTLSALSIWDSTTHIDRSLLNHDKHNDGLDPYWTTTIDCGCSNLHVQIRTQSPNPVKYGEVRILSFWTECNYSRSICQQCSHRKSLHCSCTVSIILQSMLALPRKNSVPTHLSHHSSGLALSRRMMWSMRFAQCREYSTL